MAGTEREGNARRRFRARELAAVVVLLALSAAVVAPELEHRAALRRDARRLEDLHRVQDAIERYHLATGTWPAGDPITTIDGWDASFDGEFLPELLAGGWLGEEVHDPREGARFHYVYRRFDVGRHGCASAGGFYVLGIRAFETEVFAARRPGGLRCGDEQAWDEFAHVTGGGVDGG